MSKHTPDSISARSGFGYATKLQLSTMNIDTSGSSTATVSVGMYYQCPNSTVQIGSSSPPSTSSTAPPSFRRCSIRNCPYFVAQESSTKMCEVCRGRHRIYASTKRARRKANNVGSNHNSGSGTAEHQWSRLNSVSDLQPPESTNALSPALHTVPITSSAQPQTLQLSNWTQGIDPCLFSALSSAVTLPLSSHSTSELANALVMPVSTIKPSVDVEQVQKQIQATVTVQLQDSTKGQAVPPENSNQDHPQGGDGDEPRRVCSVRGCKQMMEDSSEYKMCPACRVRYQKYGTAKRAKWRAKKEQASFEVAATVTADRNSDPESNSNGATDEGLEEGDKDQNFHPGSSKSRVSTDVSEKIGTSHPALMTVGAHIAVDDIDPVRDGGGGENVVGDYHQVQPEGGENEVRRHVETIRGPAQTLTGLQTGMDSTSSTVQQPLQPRSASANTIALDTTTVITTQGHLNPLMLSVPQLQPYPTIPIRNPLASQPSLSSSTSTSTAAAAVAAKRKSLSYQPQVPPSTSVPAFLAQPYPSSDVMVNGFSKFRVELLEAAKVALANQSQRTVEGDGNVNVNGMGMVMTASDMRVRGGGSQVFGTGAGSGGCAERVVGLAASDGSGKDRLGTKTTKLDNNTTAEAGKDVASTVCVLSAPSAVDGAAAGTSVKNGFRMDDNADKVAAAVDRSVKDGAATQSQSQLTVPTSLTSKSKRKARSKAKDGALETPTSAGEPPVSSTLTSGALPPPLPNSHPHYHHPYPPPYPYPYYPVYYPPYPGAHPYPYPYPPHPPPASQSSGKPSRKKKRKDVAGDTDKGKLGDGYGYGVGQPFPYGYPHPFPPLPPGTGQTQTGGTGVWAYPGPPSHPHPGLVGFSTGTSSSNSNASSGGVGPSYATPYTMAQLPPPPPLPPPQGHPPAPAGGGPPPQAPSQYGPYQYTCGSQPYNGTPFPLGTPVMPVSYYSVGGGVGGSGGSNVSGTSTAGTGSGRKDKGKQAEGASDDGKGKWIWTATDGGGGGGGVDVGERERKGSQEKILNESLNPSQQEPKQVQMQFSYYHYGPDGEVIETFSEGVRKKRRKVDPNYLEKLEEYRAQATREKKKEGAVAHQPSVEYISAASASASAPVPVPGFGRTSSSLKERQCAEEASSSTSTSSTVHANDADDSDVDLNAISPVGDGNGEVGLVKQKEEKQSVTQPCSNKSCTRHIVVDNAPRKSDESISTRNGSGALCGRCKARFKKMRKRTKTRFRLVPRRTVLDRVVANKVKRLESGIGSDGGDEY